MATRVSKHPKMGLTLMATREQPISGPTLMATRRWFSWKMEALSQWLLKAQLTSGPQPDGLIRQPISCPTLIATREHRISGPTLMATSWGTSWKKEDHPQWLLEAQLTSSPHYDGYPSEQQPIAGPILTDPSGSLLNYGWLPKMIARSSAYMGSSPWWLPERVNNL